MARKRRFLPVSFFGRSLLILLVPLLLLQVVSAFVFFSRHWEDVGRRLALGLGGDIAVLVEAIETYPVGPERDWIIDRARHNFEFTALWHEGEKLTTTPPHRSFGAVDWTLQRVLPERLSHPFHFDTTDGEPEFMVTSPLHLLEEPYIESRFGVFTFEAGDHGYIRDSQKSWAE